MAGNLGGRVAQAKKAQERRGGASGSPKRCKKGKACGASCINSTKLCLVDMSSEISEDVGKVAQLVQTGKAPEPAPVPAATSETPKNPDGNYKPPSADAWKKAVNGDMKEIQDGVKGWADAHGLTNLAVGHDPAHILVQSFFGTDSGKLSEMFGFSKGQISIGEETLVRFFEKLGKARAMGARKDTGSPYKTGEINPLPKDAIKRAMKDFHESLSRSIVKYGVKGLKVSNQQLFDGSLDKVADMIYRAQSRPDYRQFVDGMSRVTKRMFYESMIKKFPENERGIIQTTLNTFG